MSTIDPATDGGAVAIAGHTRWGRVLLTAGPALLIVLALAASLVTGVAAATFALGGVPVRVTAASLDATGLGLYGDTREVLNGAPLQVAAAGIESAKISGLCLSLSVPLGGGFGIKLSAPDDVEVNATNLLLDASSLEGSLDARGLAVGRDASLLSRGGVAGPAGTDGLQVDSVVLGGAEVEAYSLSAGTITLSNIRIATVGANEGC